jgi:hypothetical protein
VLVDASPAEADAILRAMRDVATAAGTRPLTHDDAVAVAAAHHYVFRAPGSINPAAIPPIAPADLAAAVTEPTVRDHAVSFLCVMATVDASIDATKIAVVARYANALDRDPDEVHQLTDSAAGKLQEVVADMARKNLLSVTGHEVGGDWNKWLVPYAETRDPDLSARYAALRTLPPGSFGRTFAEFYATNGFAFPGEAAGLNARFATPHDSTHILSGYSTSPQGELLVSSFTAGMHPHEPVCGHILPVIFTFHIGVHITNVAGDFKGALDPEKFWAAWTRGSALVVDVFDDAWDFWSHVDRPLEDMRAEYEVPPLLAALAADDRTPSWYHPTA